MKVSVIKNKVAAPFKEAEFDLYYLKGIDKNSEVSTLATQKGIVARPNNRKYEYGKYVWTSKAEYEEALNNDGELLNEIMLKAIQSFTPPVVRGNAIKIKFITQLPTTVPSFAFFCNFPDDIKQPYKNYLENQLRQNFNFSGVPIRIFFRKK